MNIPGGGAPTGCYKCGRPGHWSRDCTSDPNSSGTPAANDKAPIQSHNTEFNSNSRAKPPLPTGKQKQRNSRPKLTPDLLLSDAGIGHILRYFPKAFKYHGRGNELNDLQRLLSMYAEWHSRLLPYYNFDQFIHKVEKVGSAKRVKVCLGQLRDKISHGEDPTEPHESQVQLNSGNGHDDLEAPDAPNHSHENNWQNKDDCNLVEGVAGEINEGSTTKDTRDVPDTSSAAGESSGSTANQIQISDEQKARMEANKLKALERAAARARSLRP